VFRLSRTRNDVEVVPGPYADVQFCKVDNPQETHTPALLSQELMNRLTRGAYDVIVFRGMLTATNEAVIDRFGSSKRYAAIPGGSFRDKQMQHYGFIFYEHQGQAAVYRKELGDAPVLEQMPKYVPEAFVEAARAIPKTRDVVCVSKFVPRKNLQVLVPLFPSGMTIDFIGQGPLEQDIRAAAEGHDNVRFLGDLLWRKCVKAAAASRLLAHPSVHEGLPRAAVECFASGIPLVGLRSTLGAALGGEACCSLVSEETFVDEVKSIIADKDRLSEMSRAALAYYDRVHSPEAMRSVFMHFTEWVTAN
jgi:glycosyltransferase involved in cell wall biosynthesis